VSDLFPHDPPRDAQAAVLSELVTAQLRAARAGVFQAYLQSREKARQLAQDLDEALPERRGAA
jgi:hypothetical protein